MYVCVCVSVCVCVLVNNSNNNKNNNKNTFNNANNSKLKWMKSIERLFITVGFHFKIKKQKQHQQQFIETMKSTQNQSIQE